VVKTVPFDTATGELDWTALEQAFTPQTRLLAIGAASNALGTVTDVVAAARLAHARGALCYVDAVHYAAHVLVDVRAIDCDVLVCSPYKFYGPHIGTAYIRRELLARLDVPRLAPAGTEGGERVETGTLSHEAIVGAKAAVDFLASLAPAAVSRRAALAAASAELHARGQRQTERLWAGLRQIPGVTVYGPPPSRPRTSTVSFVQHGRTSRELAVYLASRGLFASHGDFYAQTVVERLGHAKDGLLRIGCAAYTTDDEVERVLAAIRE
jgi:selenocysteine lyase/cysteine desulfurase